MLRREAVDASIGAAVHEPQDDVHASLERADPAMYLDTAEETSAP